MAASLPKTSKSHLLMIIPHPGASDTLSQSVRRTLEVLEEAENQGFWQGV
jgi:hypothetical protein